MPKCYRLCDKSEQCQVVVSAPDPVITEMQKRIDDQDEKITELTLALNESRDQIQALLDFCFGKAQWEEKVKRQQELNSHEIDAHLKC